MERGTGPDHAAGAPQLGAGASPPQAGRQGSRSILRRAVSAAARGLLAAGSVAGRGRDTLAGGWHDAASVGRRVVVPVGQATAPVRAALRSAVRALRRHR